MLFKQISIWDILRPGSLSCSWEFVVVRQYKFACSPCVCMGHSGYSSFFPPSKTASGVTLAGYSKLPMGVNGSVCGCLYLCVSLTVNRWLVQVVPCYCPVLTGIASSILHNPCRDEAVENWCFLSVMLLYSLYCSKMFGFLKFQLSCCHSLILVFTK